MQRKCTERPTEKYEQNSVANKSRKFNQHGERFDSVSPAYKISFWKICELALCQRTCSGHFAGQMHMNSEMKVF